MSAFRSIGRKIVAVARNYKDHALELGNPIPTRPMFFLKPTSSYCPLGTAIRIPPQLDIHHEVELGVVIKKDARDVSEKDAMKYVAGYALGIDVTARDVQNAAKRASEPWTVAKGMDYFTPITDMIDASRVKNPHNLDLWLRVNNELRQKGNTNQFMFSIPYLISHISNIMTLQEGDLVLTGTPAGVARFQPGDVIQAAVEENGQTILSGKWDVKSRVLNSKVF